jgi:phage tail P2-like protein
MGMRLDNVKTIQLLPAWMRDDEANIALAKACDSLFQSPATRIKTIRTWDQIDNLSNEELDEMAWELDIDWWQSAWSLERKRATVKIASKVKEKRGTKWAVEQLVAAAFGVGEVTEWFEYGGEPYYFKIRTNATLTEDGMATFLSMIERVKSARSHIEAIEVERTIEQPLFAGCAARQWMANVILDDFAENRSAEIINYPAAGSWSWSKSSIIEHFDDIQTASAGFYSGTSAGNIYTKNTIKEG